MNEVHKVTARKLRSLAKVARAITANGDQVVQGVLNLVARDLEARADALDPPKPDIEEPLAFASVVKTRSGTLYVRLGAAQILPWGSGEDLRTWDQLDVVEVLRVGVGEAPTAAADNAHAQGFDDAVNYMRRTLIQLRSSAITAERKDADDKALEAVEVMR